ncbi:MAG TPA: hypothetical protein P5137_15640 [Candidatus Brocadiia bacterium]|nr:hypothetical protein [Candidatus Brocadiia bacterium]
MTNLNIPVADTLARSLGVFKRLGALVKSAGNPNHHPVGAAGGRGGQFAPKGEGLASSRGIKTEEQARAWFKAFAAASPYAFNVHSGGKAMPISLKVDPRANHPYTKGAKGARESQRVFDARRAKQMDRIIPVVAHPQVIVESNERPKEVYLGAKDEKGDWYVVVLKPESVRRDGTVVEVLTTAFPAADADDDKREYVRKMRTQRRTLPGRSLKRGLASDSCESKASELLFALYPHPVEPGEPGRTCAAVAGASAFATATSMPRASALVKSVSENTRFACRAGALLRSPLHE